MTQEMCDKAVNSFKPANLRLVIGKHLIISLPLHSNKTMYRKFKMQPKNEQSKTY